MRLLTSESAGPHKAPCTAAELAYHAYERITMSPGKAQVADGAAVEWTGVNFPGGRTPYCSMCPITHDRSTPG